MLAAANSMQIEEDRKAWVLAVLMLSEAKCPTQLLKLCIVLAKP